jgi:transcription antitermination factor NusG
LLIKASRILARIPPESGAGLTGSSNPISRSSPDIFSATSIQKKRLPILTTPNVVSIVGFASEPAPVPDSEIEAVQTILRSGLATEPCAFLREGKAIRVRRGALEGLEGILIKKKSEWRMVVSVAMLHRSLSVEIDREWITTL